MLPDRQSAVSVFLYPGSPEAKARPWQHICYRLCCCAGPVAVVMLFGHISAESTGLG